MEIDALEQELNNMRLDFTEYKSINDHIRASLQAAIQHMDRDIYNLTQRVDALEERQYQTHLDMHAFIKEWKQKWLSKLGLSEEKIS